jgi:hypothetical protein
VTSPSSDSSIAVNYKQYVFNVTDDSSNGDISCTVYMNGVANATSTSVANDTSTTLNASYLNDGTYTVVINCSDNVSNYGTASAFTLTVDTTIPRILPVYPSINRQNISTNYPNITLNFSDAGSGINTSSMIVLINGANYSSGNMTCTQYGISYLCNVSIYLVDQATGIWLYAYVKDNYGNSNSSNTTFGINTRSPWYNAANTSSTAAVNISQNATTVFNFTASIAATAAADISTTVGTGGFNFTANSSSANITSLAILYGNKTWAGSSLNITSDNWTVNITLNGTNLVWNLNFSDADFNSSFTATNVCAAINGNFSSTICSVSGNKINFIAGAGPSASITIGGGSATSWLGHADGNTSTDL